MSSPPVLPDQPAKARYATPSVPAAIEEGGAANEARYTGGTSISTLGPQYGAGGAAAAGGVRNANNETARRAVTIPIGRIRRTRDARRSGTLDIVGAPEAPAVLAGLFNRRGPGIEIENKLACAATWIGAHCWLFSSEGPIASFRRGPFQSSRERLWERRRRRGSLSVVPRRTCRDRRPRRLRSGSSSPSGFRTRSAASSLGSSCS